MIRARRLPNGRFGRPPYEVEYRPAGPGPGGWRKVTAYPVFDLEKIIGTGDAWALIKAADQVWDGSDGEWVAVFEAGECS